MVQDMPTPLFISKEQYKSNQIYMNGMNGSPTTSATVTTTTPQPPPPPAVGVQQQHLINTNNTESSPAAMHMPIPIPVPMPMLAPMTHHHPHHPPPQAPQQPFFPSMGPPTMTAPAIVTTSAKATTQPPPPSAASGVGGAPPSIHQAQKQQKQTPLYNSTPPTLDQNYCDYLYHVGFLQGLFSDITVNVPAIQKSFALHSLILTRSPILYRRLVNLGVHHHQQHPLIMDLDITASPETIHTIIGHLYRPLAQQDLFFIVNEKPQICIELLDATQELELEALQNHLLHVVGMSLNQNNVFHWISALLSTSQHYPSSSSQQQQRKRLWTGLLDQQIVHYLVSGLPRQLTAQHSSSSSSTPTLPPPVTAPDLSTDESSSSLLLQDDVNFGTCVQVADSSTGIKEEAGEWFDEVMDEWGRVYAELPLKYLKRCLEHKDLMVKGSVERYKFAKRVLYFREQFGKSGLTVLLQFSRADHCGILIVKKQSTKFGKWDPSEF